ncbi:caspase family protein [Schleiferia thermophila]|jgi:hypothetical protein|uniref:Uncharacterized protein n=1 Tax=Schleiferia thermophila TaxID=884107 RepID=A0A368ZZL3_9FLAO|nr:caspase family protein [Schleiferia thermophila]PMB23064.1 hypothetical protein CEN47_19185 [Fischerella thermalis CCMEE 5319]RCX02395.1 hypothetical protein DES35_104155 [Schleiferia thermophila]GCD80721.1 hypothetical protein JCM30197_19680 [Schleiferia thermophila]
MSNLKRVGQPIFRYLMLPIICLPFAGCQVTETVLSSQRELSTVEITDTLGYLEPNLVLATSDGDVVFEGYLKKPFRYRHQEHVRKVSKVKGNSRYKLGAMLLGAAGITAGLSSISRNSDNPGNFPYYLLGSSAALFGVGLAGMYVDTSYYYRLSDSYSFDTITQTAAGLSVSLSLNDSETFSAQFDTTGHLKINVFRAFKQFPKYKVHSHDTLTFFYEDRRISKSIALFTKMVFMSNAEIHLYSQPFSQDLPMFSVEEGIFIHASELQDEQWIEVSLAGRSFFVERKNLISVYTNVRNYSENLPDINQLLNTFLKNSAQRFLTKSTAETDEQYRNRLQRFEAQKLTWFNQGLEVYSLWLRDRLSLKKINLLEYDANFQLYLLEIDGLGTFPVRVNRANLNVFQENSSKITLTNIKLQYKGEAIEIDEITLFDPITQSYYSYEERMRRTSRNSRIWDKTGFKNFGLKKEIVQEFFAKSLQDFKNTEDEYILPVGERVYKTSVAVVMENSEYKHYPNPSATISAIPLFKQMTLQSMGILPEFTIAEQNATMADMFRIFGQSGISESAIPKAKGSDSALLFVYFRGNFFFSDKKEKMYLLPIDAHPDFVDLTAIDIKNVIETSRKKGYGKIVFLLDGTFYGTMPDTSRFSVSKSKDVAILVSSAPGQQSYVHPRTLTSVFLHRFLKELSASQGVITVGDIFQQMCCGMRSLPSVVREFHQQEQLPILFGNSQIEIFKPLYEQQ